MRAVRLAVPACLLAALAMTAWGEQPEALQVQVESYKLLSADSDSAQLELVVTNHEEDTPVFLGVTAKSRDGTVASPGFKPEEIPVGEHMHMIVTVMRPGGPAPKQTDTLHVLVYRFSGGGSVRVRFDWPHNWPKRVTPASAVAAGVPPETESRLLPRNVFYSNLLDEDFNALELLLSKWNTPSERDDSGEWKLEGFRHAVEAEDSPEWEAQLARIEHWKKASPRSAGAAIAEAIYWRNHAWEILGCRRCKRKPAPDPVALKLFRERMQHAQQVLDASRRYAAANPVWYEVALDVAIDRQRPSAEISRLFKAAVKKHPYYTPLYVAMARRWTPDGPGKTDWVKVESLVRSAVKRTAAEDGTQDYARIYTWISIRQDSEDDVLQVSMLSWPRMRASFREMIKAYPSAENLNEFAIFACRANDRETYLSLNPRLQEQVIHAMWPEHHSFDDCNEHFVN